MINSLHKQGVRKLASGVIVEAIADDGLVEGFKVDDVPGFALALQWHPEWKVMGNENSVKIFEAFGDVCTAYAAERQAVNWPHRGRGSICAGHGWSRSRQGIACGQIR